MKPAATLLLLAALTACSGQSSDSRGPDNSPTLPPAGLFKDGLLYAAVKARLAGSDIDSTTRISVLVHGGVVTLRGAVKDPTTRERDAKLTREIRGVKAVRNELTIGHMGPSAAQTVRDAALTATVESGLVAQTGVNVAGVKVRVSAGTVTLSGSAATAAIEATMVAAAKKTAGVRNVVDQLTVK